MAEANIKIELAEKMLTTFDGTKSKLFEFCDNCDKATSLIAENMKRVLFAIIETKITGNARALIRNRTFADWLALKNYLLETYSEKRSHGQWQLELSSCKQAYNEDVISYSQKVENCLIKLTNSLDGTQTQVERAACVKLLQNQALTVFMMGLQKDLSIIVKSQRPTTLTDAIQYAIAEENEQKSRREIQKFQNLNLKDTKHCSNCNKSGHTTINCYFKNKPNYVPRHSNQQIKEEPNVRHYRSNNHQSNKNPHTSQNTPSFNTKSCNYCKKLGHTIDECRKRAYNNSKRQSYQQNQNDRDATRQNHPPNSQNSNSNQNANTLNYNRFPMAAASRNIHNIEAE